jgi:hypothetical protein
LGWVLRGRRRAGLEMRVVLGGVVVATVLVVFGVDLVCRVVVVRVVDLMRGAHLVRAVDLAVSARGGAGRLLVLMVEAILILA